MPGENLTRIEAQNRAAIVATDSYLVKLDVTKDAKTFDSDTTIVFSCSKPGSEIFVDAITDSVSLIELNGVALDPASHSDGIRITVPGLAAQNTLRIVAKGIYSNTGEGLHRFVDPVDGEVYLYTCLLYTSPSPRDRQKSRMPSSA